MKRNTWKKRIAALALCGVLLGTSSPVQTFATVAAESDTRQDMEQEVFDDIPAPADQESDTTDGVISFPAVEEEFTETPTPTPKESAAPEETPTPETTEAPQETVRPAKDITRETLQLQLTVKGAIYQLTDKDEVKAETAQDQIDLREADASALKSLKIQIGFKALLLAAERDIKGGDTFTLTFPGTLPVLDVTAPAEIREDGDLLATYTVKDQELTAVFAQAVETKDKVSGNLTVEADMKNLTLKTNETTKAEITLPGGRKTVIHLPKAAEGAKAASGGTPAPGPSAQPTEAASPTPEDDTKEKKAIEEIPALTEEVEAPVLFAAPENKETKAVLTKKWVDNNNANGHRPSIEVFKNALTIQFQIEGGVWTALAENNMDVFGLQQIPDISVDTGQGIGNWTCSVTGLPVADQGGKAVAWRLKEEKPIAGYRKATEADAAVTNVETKDVEFNLEFLAGALDKELNADYIERGILPKVKLFKGTGAAEVGSWAEVQGKKPTIEKKNDVWVIQYQDLDAYELSEENANLAVQYSIQADNNKIPVGGDGDYLAVEYSNVEVPNHGTDIDRTYEGGDLRLLLMGDTTYEATKVWLDNGHKELRPDAVLYLWRYSDREGYDFKTAAQVQDEQGAVIMQNLLGSVLDTGVNEEKITFPNEDGGARSLPKYDTDGYPYVYIAREKLSGNNAGNYEQVFGRVVPRDDGASFDVEDVRPYQGARMDGDKSVYHTGVISNRRKGTVPVKVTKTWYAAAFQSQLRDVKVKVQLQSRYKEPEGGVWTNSGNEVVLEDFLAETLSKTYEGSAPRFDSMGRELEYRWVETGITYTKTEDGESESVTVIPDANGAFSLWLLDPITNTEREIAFQSTGRDASISGSETMAYALENRLAAEVEYKVIKKWSKGNGEYYNGNEEFLQDATITFAVTQNGMPYTKDADENGKYSIQYDAGKADEGYWVTTLKLPEYGPDGHLYEYKFKEVSIQGAKDPNGGGGVWDFDHLAYDMKEHKVTLVNVVKGPGLSFVVNKEWLDDGDLHHREDVYINIYRKGSGEYVNTAHLTQDGGWTAQVGIGGAVPKETKAVWIAETEGSGYRVMDHYYIREVAMGQYTGEPNTEDEWTKAEDNDPVQNGDVAEPHELHGTNHSYKVTYSSTDFTVTNRRIGEVNLLATKEWVDGANKDSSRPSGLELQVVTTDHKEDVALDYAAGSITIKDAAGNAVETYDQLTLKSPVATDPKKLDGKYKNNAGQEESYSYTNIFKDLPKYAADGSVIHYTLEEVDTAGALGKAEYATAIKHEKYMQGEKYSGDVMSLSVTNKRTGTKTVAFAKKWVDTYAYTNGKRPDIFLTLYRRAKGSSDALEKVEPYPDRDWYYSEGEQYSGYCEFPGVAKYDNNGAEYIYYATEESTANAKANDYTDVYYKGTVLKADNGTEEALTNAVQSVTDAPNGGSGTAPLWYLKEGQAGAKDSGGSDAGGYFENRLEADVKLTAIKTWTNIPEGFQSKDLPAVKISALRYETNADGTKDEQKTPFTAVGKVSYQPDEKEADQRIWTLHVDTYQSSGDTELDGKPLQRYDSEGKRYLYELKEAGVAIADSVSEEATENKDGSVSIGGVPIYTIPMPSKDKDTWKLTNVFDDGKGENKGSLTVTKNWVRDQDETGPYPSVEFTLYRTYSTDAAVAPENLGKKRLNSDQAAAAPKVDSNGKGSLTFDGLAIYAPNGEKYKYYVVETPVNGYTVSTANAPKNNPYQSQSVELEKSTAALLTKGALGFLSKAAVLSNGISANSLGILKDSTDIYQAAVAYTNTYDDKGSITLTGSKVWEDYSNAFETRPNDLEITVERYAASQSGQGNDISTKEEVTVQSEEEKQDNYLKWDRAAEAQDNKWSYTIKNLERYAPNGMPWIYEVTEGDVTNYSHTNSATQTGKVEAGDTQTGNVTVPAFKNNSYVTWNVEKKWKNIAADIQKPDVEVKLQIRAGDKGQWIDASKYFTDLNRENITWPKTKLVLNQKSGWKGSFEKLPIGTTTDTSSAGSYVAFQYRAVETKIGDTKIALAGDSDTNTNGIKYANTSSIYTVTQAEDQSNKKSVITNALNAGETTSLTIGKNWQDQNDKYGIRPKNAAGKWSVQFEIWRKVKGDADSPAEQVKDADGNPYIVTIGEATPGSKVIIEGLPAETTAASDDKQYIYYAVEIKPENTSLNDNSGYNVSGEGADKVVLNNDQKTYTSTITNTMKTTAISGSKTWVGDSGELAGFRPEVKDGKCPDVTLTLWSNTGADLTTGWKEVSGAAPIWAVSATESNTWTWTYKDLPITDAAGKAYSYSVTESTAGYVPAYDNAKAAAPTIDGSGENEAAGTAVGTGTVDTNAVDRVFNGGAITNTLTGFTLRKTGKAGGASVSFGNGTAEGDNPASTIKPLSEIILGIYKDVTKVAEWKMDTAGTISAKVSKGAAGADVSWIAMPEGSGGRLQGLPMGTYTLKEESVPQGYKKAEDIPFTIGADGKLTSTTGGAISAEGTVLAMMDEPTSISIQKTDENGAGLAGAGFSLTGKFVHVPAGDSSESTEQTDGVTWTQGASSGTYTAAWTSATGAQVFTSQLIAGETYTLTETSAPAGYKAVTAPVTFKLSADGSKIVRENGGDWLANTWVTVGEDKLSLMAKNEKTAFSVVKLGEKEPNSAGGETVPVAGAALKICKNTDAGKPGDVVSIGTETLQWKTTVSDSSGTVTADKKEIKGLPAGAYWLVEEEAPIDYRKAEPIPFTLNADGTLELDESAAGDLDKDTLTITMVDETFRGSVVLTKEGKKLDAAEASLLPGVTFELYRQNGDTPNPDSDEKIKNAADESAQEEQYTFATDENGQIEVDNLRGGHYYFIETGMGEHADDGYYLPKGPVGNFTIDVTNSGAENSPAVEVNVINSDFVTHLQLTKVDAEAADKKLSGGQFTLTRAGDDQTTAYDTPKTLETDADGTLSFEIRESGKYTLKESKAPYGYQLGDTPYEAVFTIPAGAKQDALNGAILDLSTKTGSVAKEGASEEELAKMLESYALKVPEDFYREEAAGILNTRATGTVTLHKVDEEGQPLSGVTFTLYKKGGEDSLGEFSTGSTYTYASGNTNTVENGADGILIIQGLPWGEYYLKETKADGYEIPETTYPFTIGSAKGAEADVPAGMKGEWHQGSGMQINLGQIQNTKSRISIRKGMTTDGENMAGAAGAKFSLEGKFLGDHEGEAGWEAISDGSDKNYKFTWTSEAEGQSFAGLLMADTTYMLTEYAKDEKGETIIPQGALPLTENAVFTIQIGADGKVASVTPADKNADGVSCEVKDGLSVIVKDPPTRLRVYKKGTDTDGQTDDPLLKECSFEVTPEAGSAFAPARTGDTREAAADKITVTTTGKEGEENELTGRLMVGHTYRITEVIPPIGYELGIELVFTVTAARKDGTGAYFTSIQPTDPDDTNYELSYDGEGNPIITQRDNPITAWIQKTDSSGSAGLNGAKFTIQGMEGSYVIDAEGKPSEGPVEFVTAPVVTGEPDAGLTVDGIMDVSKRLQESNEEEEHIYILRETVAPGGYEQLRETIYFKIQSVWVNADGVILENPKEGAKPEGAVMRRGVFRILYKEDVPEGMAEYNFYTPDAYRNKLNPGTNADGEPVSSPIRLTIANDRRSTPPSTTWHTVTKTWNDNSDALGKRLKAVEAKLQQRQGDGSFADMAGQPVLTLDQGNGWTATWTGLPYGGEYQAVEVTDLKGTGYTSSAVTSGTNTVITNTYAEDTQTPTPTPTVTPDPSGTPTPTDKPDPSHTPTPTGKPNPSGTPTGTVKPTVTRRPTVAPAKNRPGTTWNSSATSGSNTSKAENTKTGDDTDMQGILLLLGLSAAAAALSMLYLGRRRNRK